MAKANIVKTAMCLNSLLILSLLITITATESRSILAVDLKKVDLDATLSCDLVYGVGSGDTCFSIAQGFNLSNEFFESINPNLNCDALFVGQWLCVDGTVN